MGRSSIVQVGQAPKLLLDRVDYVDLRSTIPTVVTAKHCEYTGFRRNVGGTGTMSVGLRLDG